jgi:D-alanyl-D-alanine carboxypeptidase (penicillin-binding protein 5/6)
MPVLTRALALAAAVLPALALAMAEVTAESAIVVEAASGKVMWEKDAHSRRYPASTTKIMTALLLIENVPLDTLIKAPRDVELVPGSSLYLKPFEAVTAEDLLYAILLRSANDAAYTAAVHIAGSQRKFARMMNARASQIGCTGTNFTNPHGLHDPDHYTTAADLALIAREAMKNETFAKVARTEYRFIERSMNDEDVLLTTHNKFLKERDDATGIKTGWTNPAGRCFVGSAERGGLSVVTVVLKSTSWKEDSHVLADWAFDAWTADAVIAQGQVLASVPVEGGDRLSLPLAASADYAVARPRGAEATVQVVGTDVSFELPVLAGQRVGTVTFRDQDGANHTMAVFAAADVNKARFFGGGHGPFTVGLLVALVGGAWLVRRRALRV